MAATPPRSIFFSAGHTGVDPGAVGRRKADIAVEFREWSRSTLCATAAPNELDGQGTENLPLREVASHAKHCPIVGELLFNAAPNADHGRGNSVWSLGSPRLG